VHALPQPPQFVVLVCVSTQAPPHDVPPEEHLQAPATQVLPPPHVVVQLPQAALFAVTSTHLPPQSAWPVAHVGVVSASAASCASAPSAASVPPPSFIASPNEVSLPPPSAPASLRPSIHAPMHA
jgi:hypothetical protein